MICDRCYREMSDGDHGVGLCPLEPRRATAVHQDSVPGGFWAENGFAEPRRFDSHSEHARALAAEGLEIRAKWAGEHDRHLTRWDTVDLNAAAALVQRGAQARREKNARWKGANAEITVTDGESFTGKDLEG